MTTPTPHYDALAQRLKQATHLEHILRLAHWDATTMLAPGSAPSRLQEIATVAALLHQLRTAPEVGRLLEAAEVGVLDEWQRMNVTLARKAYEEARCITPALQEEYSNTAGACEFVWRTARKNNDFKLLVPHLDRLFDLTRKMAQLKAERFGKRPYDVLLDSYNPDFTSASVREIYGVLKTELPSLMGRIVAKQAQERVVPLTEKIDVATQRAINLRVLQMMGFSLDHGRLDESAHPFCEGSNDDVRLTTRYFEDDFLFSLTGSIHEAGHGLYLQNLPKAYRDQPVGVPKGLSVHESQSIIMERQAATSPAFMERLAALLSDEFGLRGPAYTGENLYRLLTRVQPSLIRFEADEVTYPLHVILRFEIEEEIIHGGLAAKDLPAAWATKMKEYLGIVPETDAAGCMQDIHWPSGLIGYFPAYTNGAIMASMLMQAARKQHAGIDAELRNGSFWSLNSYLTERLRRLGSLKSSADLLEGATGYATLQPGIFVEYLKEKYL